MCIERFGEKVFDTVMGMGEHLGKENRLHYMTHGFDGTQSHAVNGFIDFATSHPLLLITVIGTVGLLKTLSDD